ncbi:MAG TPA: hypothetical protein V6D18_09450 [Thermosynechococcaceae cyanobacterium]
MGQSQPSSALRHPNQKRLGGHLIEAGLLTTAQVDVALNDQRLTGMRFGEVIVARGWVKRQTIEYLMKKVVLPEQQALLEAEQAVPKRKSGQMHFSTPRPTNSAVNGTGGNGTGMSSTDLHSPISKPLPSTGSEDEGVSWVG